jgi:hypothetical protein
MRRMLRGLRDTLQSGSPQALGIRAFVLQAQIFEDENDDEDDYDSS